MPHHRSDLHVLSSVPAAAVLTGAAGLIHMAAAVTHVVDSLLFGLVFALTGWVQMIAAIWLSAGRGRAALTVMSVTNVAAVVAWLLSRTVGLPVLHSGVEAAGAADVLTVGLEVLALAAAVALARGRAPGDASWRRLPIGLAAAAVVALAASGSAVAALGSSGGHGHGEDLSASGDETGHQDPADGDMRASGKESIGPDRQPGTLPANLHRHRPGIYHLHENIELHEHARGIVHVHASGPSTPSAEEESTGDGGSGEVHDGTDDHAH